MRSRGYSKTLGGEVRLSELIKRKMSALRKNVMHGERMQSVASRDRKSREN